ncbi:MAG: ABC transporter ATP-binding protein [Synechococcus sp.]
MALLTVRNLTTHFHTPTGIVRAVNGVSFEVHPGETVGVVGESGSGKSITVLSLLRLLPSPPAQIVEGEVWFSDRDLLQLAPNEMRKMRGDRIGTIFQDPMTSLNPVLTVERQLTEALRLHLHMGKGEARERAIELLDRVGIPDAAKRLKTYPHQFSGGMRQRVMIAMGVACKPELLIADEPTTALDVTIQAQIVALMKELRQEIGMATIWITHDLSLLAGLADRILVMYAGQIVESAPLHQLYDNPRHPYTLGLLQSIPRMDEVRRTRLKPIDGKPPDLIRYPIGCPFAPRCPFAIDRCLQEDPDLATIGPQHRVACWVQPQGTQVLAEFREASASVEPSDFSSA